MFSATVIFIFITHFMHISCFTFHRDNECVKGMEAALNMEFYKKDDSLFIVVSERVSWFEAVSICKYYEATLSMPNYTAKADFIAFFLAESNFRFEDFWLGAKYKKEKSEWIWVDDQLVKLSNISIPGPWGNTTDGKDCLSIERSKHYTPIFAALSCYLPKPFICERSLTTRTNKPLPSLPTQTIHINNSIFTIYHSRTSWDKALAFCRSIGQRLAAVPNDDIIKSLRYAMLRARPCMSYLLHTFDIENAWIGGQYFADSWTWVSTGVKIPNIKQDDGYPPWLDDAAGKTTDGCLLLDRHFQSAYFVPERCQRRRDFICEQYVHTTVPVEIDNSTIICPYQSINMYIHLTEKNWKEAQSICHNNDTILAEPSHYDILRAISVCLGDHATEPRHVWLGGKLNEQWRWVYTNKTIETALPWCEEQYDVTSACLNLDRTDHDIPFIYGLECKKKQPFVCWTQEAPDTTVTTGKPNITITTPKICNCPCEQPPIAMHYKNETYIAFIFNIEKENVLETCQYFGGKPFSSSASQETKNYVLANIRLAIDLCGCCTHDNIDFWINDNNACSTINLQSSKISQVKNCNTIKQPFICQIFCNEAPNIQSIENATTDCEWLRAAGKIPYRSCKFGCGNGYSLFGPDRFTCDHYGWKMYAVENVTFFRFPDCHKTENTPRKLITVLNEIKSKGFYFAVRESQKMGRAAWVSILQFINSIIQVFPISKDDFFGFLTFSNTVKIRIPYGSISSCSVLEKLRNMEISEGSQNTRYDLALSEIQKELQRKQPQRKNLIFFIVDKENTGEDYDKFVEDIHENNKIFVVGITGDKFIFDLDMVASISFRYYRLYTMKVRDYSALKSIADGLLDYRSPNINLNQLPKTDIDVIQENVTFYVIKNSVSYQESKNQCREKFGGDLINENVANSLFAKIKQFHIKYFWIQKASQCMAAVTFSQKFQKTDCKTKYPFVCLVDCSVLPRNNIDNNVENIGDEPHSFGCQQKNELLWGPPDLKCDRSKGGWTTNGYRRSPFPKCLSDSSFVEKMLQTISNQRNKNKAGVLFVLDESKSVNKADFEIQLEFAKLIAKLYPASEALPYGLITVSKDAVLRIPYNNKDSCKFVKNVASIKLKTVGDVTNYASAIRLIDKQIGGYREVQANAVFFVTNGLFIGKLLDVTRAVSNLLRWKVEIFVLKIGQFISQVTPELPTRDSEYNLNLYNMPSYSAFKDISKKLLKGAKWPPLKC